MTRIVVVMLVVTLASPCVASAQEADRQALRAVAKTFEDALRQRDLSRFQAVLAPEFAGVMVTNEAVNRDSIKKFWDWAWGLIGPKGTWTTQVTPEPATFYGDLAVARGTARDHIVTERGGEWRFTWNWTAVFKRTGAEWKLIAGHGSMDPLSNTFVQAELKGVRLLFGGGGLVVGLVAGAGATLLLRRRRAGTSSG